MQTKINQQTSKSSQVIEGKNRNICSKNSSAKSFPHFRGWQETLVDQTRMLMLYWISTDTLLTYSLNNPGGGALCLTDSSKDQVISNQLAVVGLYGAVCLLAR